MPTMIANMNTGHAFLLENLQVRARPLKVQIMRGEFRFGFKGLTTPVIISITVIKATDARKYDQIPPSNLEPRHSLRLRRWFDFM